ncbi:MAG: hypothetical protein EXS42_05045 [Lacunisphaera sp.]|nr:hypothetical protein [Lacunisphaera sp.]
MKSRYLLLPLLALAACFASSCSYFTRQESKHTTPAPSAAGRLAEPTDQDAAWLAKARADYPLKTCVVSNEELGGMGGASDRIYRQAGQPDRLVRFCCESCLDDFNKDPVKYLKLIDAPAIATAQHAAKPHH